MSYKAFGNIKSYLEVEHLKTLTYEQINKALNDQNEEITQLRQRLAEANANVDDLLSDALFRSVRVRDLEAQSEAGEAVGEVENFYGVGCSGHTEIVRLKHHLNDGTKLYTHPAPVVPEGYVLVEVDDLEELYGAAQFTDVAVNSRVMMKIRTMLAAQENAE